MQWSYSGSKMFQRCQRRWYFDTSVVNPNPKAKDRIRREAFFLAQLQSIEEWRGSVVDTVIEKKIILPLKRHLPVGAHQVIEYAAQVFDAQLTFARDYRSRKEGMTKTQAGDEYAALFTVEYGYGIQDQDVQQAWNDVETALTNLLETEEVMRNLHDASDLIPQRALYLHENDFTIRAVPDVIAFYREAPPLIIDWKVHTRGTHDYWLQLAVYAIVLTRGKSHADFPSWIEQYSPTDVRLAEVQLLLDQNRKYQLSDEDVDAVESYIWTTATDMLLALGNKDNEILRPYEFEITRHPENCTHCPFQKMCGAETIWPS